MRTARQTELLGPVTKKSRPDEKEEVVEDARSKEELGRGIRRLVQFVIVHSGYSESKIGFIACFSHASPTGGRQWGRPPRPGC